MIDIRPVSDIRNKFTEVESSVQDGHPIFLTKNGYGTMVLISMEQYSDLINNIEEKLDEADRIAVSSSKRLSHNEAFGKVRNKI